MVDTAHAVPVAPIATFPPKNAENVLPPDLLNGIAAQLDQIPCLTAPVWLRCGSENAVFIRDPHTGRRGKRNRYSWTRHASEDQARFFFACAPGSCAPVDDIAAENIYLAETASTQGKAGRING